MNYRITEDNSEIIDLGHQIALENQRRYPQKMIDDFKRTYREFISDDKRLTDILYSAIYSQQIYGTSLIEYAMYNFENRSHIEKTEYVTWFSRYIYMAFLNKNKDLHLLDNKYEAYLLLRPYYKRDAMLVTDENDYESFCNFASRHKSIFVKPANLELAEGVHRLIIDSKTNLQTVFRSLLEEAKNITSDDITRPIVHQLILEEEIVQSKDMARFNSNEMSILRVTTILIKDKVHFFYPCFRMMCGDGKNTQGELYSIEALIDAKTGIVSTDGIESLRTVEFHPSSGVKIKGYKMPQWKELLNMLEDAARKLPTLRYIGWDVAHTDNGWCIIEGNSNGEFCMSQMCVGHGLKHELEDIIGFQVPFGFMLEKVEQIIEDRKNKRYEEQN